MSWQEKMKEFGGGELAFLSEDGETLDFIVVGEPVLLEGKYKGKPSEKIGCPVVTLDGYSLLVAGKRLARKISKHEGAFELAGFRAIRHGEQGDIDAIYDLKLLDDLEVVKRLFEIKEADFKPEQIDESVKAAEAVMGS